jgi:hypothetical protein
MDVRTHSPLWLPATLVLAIVSAVAIAVAEAVHAPTASFFAVMVPALWGALAVIAAGAVLMLADDVALVLIRRKARGRQASRGGRW